AQPRRSSPHRPSRRTSLDLLGTTTIRLRRAGASERPRRDLRWCLRGGDKRRAEEVEICHGTIVPESRPTLLARRRSRSRSGGVLVVILRRRSRRLSRRPRRTSKRSCSPRCRSWTSQRPPCVYINTHNPAIVLFREDWIEPVSPTTPKHHSSSGMSELVAKFPIPFFRLSRLTCPVIGVIKSIGFWRRWKLHEPARFNKLIRGFTIRF